VADLAKEVADRIGIDYKIVPVKDEKYGSIGDDGKWNGMIGELIRGVSSNHLLLLTVNLSVRITLPWCSFKLFCLFSNRLFFSSYRTFVA